MLPSTPRISGLPREMLNTAHGIDAGTASLIVADTADQRDPNARVAVVIDKDKPRPHLVKLITGGINNERDKINTALDELRGKISEDVWRLHRTSYEVWRKTGCELQASGNPERFDCINRLTAGREAREEFGLLIDPEPMQYICAQHKDSKKREVANGKAAKAKGYHLHVYLAAMRPPISGADDIRLGDEQLLAGWVSLRDLNDIAVVQASGDRGMLRERMGGGPSLIERLDEQLGIEKLNRDRAGKQEKIEVVGVVPGHARAIQLFFDNEPFRLFCDIHDLPCVDRYVAQ